MKVIRLVWIATLAGSLTAADLQAQSAAEYMAEALGDALLKMQVVDLGAEVDFTQNHYGLLGGRITEGGSLSQTLTLSGGVTYIFVAGGDRDVLDTDIYLENASGVLVMQDTEADATPVIMYTPPDNGRYRVKLSLYESRRGYDGYCVLLILKRV